MNKATKKQVFDLVMSGSTMGEIATAIGEKESAVRRAFDEFMRELRMGVIPVIHAAKMDDDEYDVLSMSLKSIRNTGSQAKLKAIADRYARAQRAADEAFLSEFLKKDDA